MQKNNSSIFLTIFFTTILISITAGIIYNSNTAPGQRKEKVKSFVPADDWFEKQRAFPFEEIPDGEYIKSIEYVKQNIPSDKNINAAWTLAGPINIEGRISTIAIHPTNPQIVYTGCANGGIWKSTNFCQSWVSVFDNQNTSSIGALAIDPGNPQVIYCGTGESNSLRSYYPGTGMYKSTDAGATWQLIGLANTFSIGNVVVNPTNTQEIYAAAVGSLRRKTTDRGIYKSTNGGLNWTQSLYVADSVGAIDVILDPSNPSKVFAAMWERLRREDYVKYGGPKSALYLSTNSGQNWTIVTGFPYNDATLGRVSLDICTANPNIIYALTANTNGSSRGIYKTTNGGTNWTLFNTSVANSSNYAWFNRICKVNPNDANLVYGGGLYMERSINGGTSFSSIGAEHVDQHAVAFAPSNPNYVIIGNDGGIEYSTNGGSAWQYSHTLPVTQFYAGDINFTTPNDILGGAQDNGTVRTTTGALNNWTDIYGGDGFYCLIDYSNPSRVYASSQNGYLGYSVNGGALFNSGTNGLDLTYSNWSTPYVMDKNTPLTLYCGTYKIHKTTNAMQSWTAISPDLANGHVVNLGTITTVDVSKSNPNVIYCGTDDANVWVTQNGGTNWTKINSGLPYRWVTRVTIHPDSANVCYVSLSGYKVDSTGSHIFRTTNYGALWTSIKGNLPDAPVNDIIIDPDRTSTLYIGTDISVMTTTNLGANWTTLGTGFPTYVPVHDLTYHRPTGKLIAWTHGRSALSIIIPSPSSIGNNGEAIIGYRLYQNYPNPFNPVTKIKYDLKKEFRSQESEVKLSIFDILGKKIKDLVSEKLQPGTYEVTFDGSNLPSGVYFYKLSAGNYTETEKMLLLK